MQRNFLILFSLAVNCILLFQFGCQSQGLPPQITFEKVTHDFGEVGPMKKKTTEFKFANTGRGLLKIAYIETCCGVIAKINPKKYKPGKSGIVKVEYLSGENPGLEKKHLYVISNDKANPKLELMIDAKVVIKVDWKPKSFKVFESSKSTSCPKITITSLDNQPFSITSFKSSLNCITADIDFSTKSTKFVLEPKIDPAKLSENLRGYLHIGINHPDCNIVSIPFEVQSRFIISPQKIIVLNAEPKSPVIKHVQILNNYGEEFEIASASSQNNFIKLLNQNKISTGYELEIEITPPEQQGEKLLFTDTLFVNLTSGQKITIPCSGYYLVKE